MLKYFALFLFSSIALTIQAQNSNAYLKQGDSLVSIKMYSDALVQYSKAISADSKNKVAYFKRGLLYDAFNNDSAALADYNASLAIDNSYADVLAGRAYLFQKLNNNKAALDDFNKVIAITPNANAETYFARGYQKYVLKDYNGALSDYLVAYGKDSAFESVILNCGNTEQKLGDYSKATWFYNKVLKLDSNNAKAYAAKGSADYNLGDNYQACLDWSKSAELGFSGAGDALKQYFPYFRNQPKGSFLEIFQHANLLKADNHEERLKLYSEAIGVYMKHHDRIDSLNFPGAYMDRAGEYVALERYKDAKKDYEYLVKLFPKDFDIYMQEGLMANKQKEYKQAITYFNKAIELDTLQVTIDVIYYSRARAKADLGDKVGACNDVDKFKDLGEPAEEFIKKVCEK